LPLLRAVCEARRGVVRPGPSARRSRLAGRAAGIARPAVNRLWNLAPERRVPPRWPAPAAYAV